MILQAFVIPHQICFTLETSDLSTLQRLSIQDKFKTLISLLINFFLKFYYEILDTYKISCDIFVSYRLQ